MKDLRVILVVSVLAAFFLLVAGSGFALDVLENQTGYERYAPKVFRAQRATDYGGNGTFTVKTSGGVDTCTGVLVRKGGLWNKWYWEGDFSSLAVDGDYYISATVGTETNTSYTFNVGVGSLLNRTGVPTYQYFTAQRCGTAVSFLYQNRTGNMVIWSHNLCHIDDGYIQPSGPYLDTAGGWHDSGEYQKYGQFFGSHAVYDLCTLYDSNRSYFDSQDTNSNGIADILDEATYQARWLAKMVDGNGHVMKQISKRRSGASWVKPENDTDNIIGTSDDRWVEIGDDNTPTPIITSSSLIKMHRVLASKGLPTENFASKALTIWNYLAAIAQGGGHNNMGDASHHIWAGLDLYAVYGQQNCWDRAVQKVDEVATGAINNPASYDTAVEGAGYDLWALAWFARNYPTQPQAATATTAVQALMSNHMNMANDPVGLIRRNEGGNIIYFPANPDLGINRLYGTITMGAIESYRLIGDGSYLRFALDQYNWMLGANYFRTCMMEAVGDSYVNKYHTRYDTFIANGIEPGVVINGYIRDGSGLPWLDFGTGSVSAQTNESWLPNSAAYAAGLAGMNVFATSNQSPYAGVINLPGTVQAENYDIGGESIAYRDTSGGNSGGAYRSDNVDIESCSEGGYDVGWIDTGEWLEYTVNVTSAGTYDVRLRVAAPNAGGSFHVLMNGRNVTGVTSVPNTGGWQTWTTVTVSGVSLSAGQQTLSVYVDSGGWNLNYVEVASGAATNNAQYVSDTIPTTMTAGQQYNVSVTMQNTGSTTWTNAAGYKLGAVGDSDPFCAFTRVLLGGGDSIGPGQQKTFSFTMTAPTTPNTYTTDWRMVREGVEWFGGTLTKSVQVNAASDTTAPTFGGSINPSTTDTLTPTITITAQDTGVGLNVGSAEFAYSVDGGTSFGTYVGRYVLHSKGTGGSYWYPDFYHPSYAIASGDHLQYDIYSNNADGKGSVDLEGSFGNLRDSGKVDQNGLSGHPNTNLYSRDYHQWYHRDFDLSSWAGQTITDYEMGHETDGALSEFYVRNVIITNNGLVKDKAANADAWTSVSDTIGPGNNGYTSTIGPEMITSDPASPAACTGSNGTTALQTVSAVFSTGMSPLVVGSNNRIKYHISDMSGNRATSSTFTITVNVGGQTPYAGVIAIPGTIQAENYDNGGEGVAYHDLTSGNTGGQYRSDNVDIRTTTDTGGGYNVGWIDSGEWLEYTVNVAGAGDYDFYVRVASGSGGTFKILIDGADATGNRSFANTGGGQSFTTLIVPARYLTAGQHILQFNVVTGGFDFNKIDVYSRGADAVACDLGSGEVLDGMTHIQVSDGDTVPWTSAGHYCRENVDFPDVYMYFGVSDSYAYNGNRPSLSITFDYYDIGVNRLDLQYDSTTNAYQVVTGPTLTNTLTWKSYTFTVNDAYFGNRQNGGADFRIAVSGQQEWGVDTVCVYQ
ncbi:MAG: carbohydrate-binding protein [Armatimonadota bacterium]|nr:carbohydrate-binding protein [Armatimonadota bacterium]